jgi:hypothetical protein
LVSAAPYMLVHFYYGASGAGVATKKFCVAVSEGNSGFSCAGLRGGRRSGWMGGRI